MIMRGTEIEVGTVEVEELGVGVDLAARTGEEGEEQVVVVQGRGLVEQDMEPSSVKGMIVRSGAGVGVGVGVGRHHCPSSQTRTSWNTF